MIIDMRNVNERGDLPPIPPQAPDPLSCCSNNCGEACVWTLYQHALRRYEIELAQWQARQGGAGLT
jgi:hypothetical protein